MQDAKEEVRARLAIEDVIGEYVQLKRAGRNFKGLSPFSGEKTPSFVVSPEKQIWHDFSSGKGGDVFSFVMQVEGMDFRQALEHLARKAGVELTAFSGSGDLQKRKARLYDVLELAARYFQQSLLSNQHALDYVFRVRKLNKKVVQDFQIGYAPDTADALVVFLTKKGFSKKELADAGLTNRFGGDLFRGRMVVPLMDSTSRVIGFTARIIRDDPKAPKYLNTPQTLLYDKSRHVFGLSQAKEAIRTQGYAVVVEGNLDVVSSHQAGVKQVVASAGTAMTEYHLKALRRLAPTVRLAFDGDRAGLEATERAIPIAQSAEVELTIVSLPSDVKDPDELLQRDPKLWQAAIDAAAPVVDWVLGQYEQREDLQTAKGKRAFSTAGLRVIAQLSDPVEQDHYLGVVATKIDSSKTSLLQKLQHVGTTEQPKRLKPVVEQAETATVAAPYEDDLLAMYAVDPASREQLSEEKIGLFHGEERQALARYLVTAERTPLSDVPKSLHSFETYVKIVLLRAEERYLAWSGNDRYYEAARLLRKMELTEKEKQKTALVEKLREAEAADDESRAHELRTQLNSLIKELRHGR